MKTKILGTGLSGLVGSRIVELLGDTYDFENLSLETGVDITDKEQVEKKIVDSPAGVVLHLAAKADVDGCEKDKILGEKGDAWRINVLGTQNVSEAAKKSGKKIIYISTDFVFDGNRDFYTEEDIPNPLNWYAVTKYEGEKKITDSQAPYLICRLAFPYRANFIRNDFIRGLLEKLRGGQKLAMVTDEIITPTFIDDIGWALDSLIKNQVSGIYHVVGSSYHSPVEIGHLLTRIFGLNDNLISETSREKYFAGRAPRPWKLALKNDKLKKLGVQMSTLEEGLNRLKTQLI